MTGAPLCYHRAGYCRIQLRIVGNKITWIPPVLAWPEFSSVTIGDTRVSSRSGAGRTGLMPTSTRSIASWRPGPWFIRPRSPKFVAAPSGRTGCGSSCRGWPNWNRAQLRGTSQSARSMRRAYFDHGVLGHLYTQRVEALQHLTISDLVAFGAAAHSRGQCCRHWSLRKFIDLTRLPEKAFAARREAIISGSTDHD